MKARWLGNFCPRQPVHRALKRQQQPRPLSAAPGSSALNRPGPAREFQVRSSGPPGLFRSGPPAQDNMPQPGLAPLPRFRERPASQDHQPRTGSACNIHAPSPLRRVLRSSTGRPRTGVQVTSSGSSVPPRPGPPAQSNALSTGSTPPLQGTARLVRFIGPAPGRPAITALRCAGFYGPQLAGPARKLGSLARVHRAHPGSGPPAQVTRDGQGSTAPLQGTARPAHPVRFIDPAPGQPDGSRTPLGFIGPAPGVGPL